MHIPLSSCVLLFDETSPGEEEPSEELVQVEEEDDEEEEEEAEEETVVEDEIEDGFRFEKAFNGVEIARDKKLPFFNTGVLELVLNDSIAPEESRGGGGGGRESKEDDEDEDEEKFDCGCAASET